MKSFTDIEQSKKLAEILPIESADMYYAYNIAYSIPYKNGIGTEEPCWSLAALLEVLQYRIDNKYRLELGKLNLNEGWYVCYDDNGDIEYYVKNSNLIDACYEMILKLHEQKLM